MNDESVARHRRAKLLFDELVLLEPAVRADRLTVIRGEDPQLAAQLGAMLAADDEAGTFMARPVLATGGQTRTWEPGGTTRRSDASASATANASMSFGGAGSDSMQLSGRRVGPYLLGREIGRGAMGVVYEAVDTVLGRKVAVKRVVSELAKNPGIATRFHGEAQLLAKLSHPNLASVYNFVDEGGAGFMIMELLAGHTLADEIEAKGAVPPAVATRWLLQALAGLRVAHREGVVHRDLKPANLFLTRDDRIKVMDFGVARVGVDGSGTAQGQLIGTPAYMAPELAAGQTASVASDVYALGMVLFELVVGVLPQAELGTRELLQQRRQSASPKLPPGHPPMLASIIDRALAFDPHRRYPDADAFMAALDGPLHHEGAVESAGASAPHPSTGSSAASSSPSSDRSSLPSSSRADMTAPHSSFSPSSSHARAQGATPPVASPEAGSPHRTPGATPVARRSESGRSRAATGGSNSVPATRVALMSFLGLALAAQVGYLATSENPAPSPAPTPVVPEPAPVKPSRPEATVAPVVTASLAPDPVAQPLPVFTKGSIEIVEPKAAPAPRKRVARASEPRPQPRPKKQVDTKAPVKVIGQVVQPSTSASVVIASIDTHRAMHVGGRPAGYNVRYSLRTRPGRTTAHVKEIVEVSLNGQLLNRGMTRERHLPTGVHKSKARATNTQHLGPGYYDMRLVIYADEQRLATHEWTLRVQ